MAKIRVIGKIILNRDQYKRLEKLGAEYIASEDPISRTDVDEIIKRIDGAAIVLNNVASPMPKEVLEKCPDLKFIQTWSTGTDHIDLEYAKLQGIRVANVRDYSTEAVAERIIGVMIIVANNLIAANQDAKEGNWDYRGFVGLELKDKTLLTVGNGKIAKRISVLAKSLGMKIINTDSKTSKDELMQHVEHANFITINCPLNNNTHHIIGREQFKRMKGVILINYGRDGIIDEDALFEALENKNLRFVALDVFEKEPPDKNNPLIHHPRVFVTPHCSWNTEESIIKLADRCIDNIEAYLKGNKIDFVV